jgi:hypothetical protein
MRLFRTLPALAGLFFGARASASRLDVRAPIDVCASLHTQLVVPNVMGILTAVGVIGASTHSVSMCHTRVAELIDRCLPLCLGYTPFHPYQRGRDYGRHDCRRRYSHPDFDAAGPLTDQSALNVFFAHVSDD